MAVRVKREWVVALETIKSERLLNETVLVLGTVEPGYAWTNGVKDETPSFIKLGVSVDRDMITETEDEPGVMNKATIEVYLLVKPTEHNLKQVKSLINQKVTFEGLDGKFSGDFGNMLKLTATNVKRVP